ncbi:MULTISPECIES: EAL domain-containing protein [unclassified Parafrankia]|uniref:sensor domain-containing phosphodiesterase n=1 Tax=unclassified Parafrankia TaxID=2994368 RepID=UPI000DA4E90E|nr:MULTISPECIES: EAL domain-containing protein [unclassified Parafrankia]SQD98723.1 Diguanylate phosphodiesterase with GAF sensor(S) [Parafrankia sp. Ea1.12]
MSVFASRAGSQDPPAGRDGRDGRRGRDRRVGGRVRERTDEVARVLDLARRHLGTDVAWLSRFTGDEQVIDLISGEGELVERLVGRHVEQEATYCARVLDGRLPAVIPDARADQRTAALAVTRELGIGSYVGAPVYLDSGEFYGMLCALSTEPDPGLGDREARFLGLLADVVADAVSALHRGGADDDHIRSVIAQVIARGGPVMVFQPVFDLPTHGLVGAEALARFPTFPAPPGEPAGDLGEETGDQAGGAAGEEADDRSAAGPYFGDLPPDRWFAHAASVGMGIDLELAAIRAAVAELPRFPRGLSLAVNASPATIASGRLGELLAVTAADQLIVEITERDGIHDLPGTLARLYELRDMGVRIAVDNVGVAYASLRRLVQILPDVVKMNRWLTTDVGADAARRALVEALVHFSRQIGACLVAEGIQRADELRVLTAAGVDQGQGEFLGPPGPLPLPAHGRCVPVRPGESRAAGVRVRVLNPAPA